MDGGVVFVMIIMVINVVNVNEFLFVFIDIGKLFNGIDWYLIIIKGNL